ncbi:hypothetical protein CY35_04G071900 [Sphagnum magellanicum]|nr:hypothetical protein CY35_04G071900 [Sphagnum magellanicum]
MWPSDCCCPPWNKFVQVTAMSARASGKSLENTTFTHKMSGNCLGIIGLDCLGLASAKRAEAFGCKVSYCAR